MKKGVVIGLLFVGVLVLSLSFTSAGLVDWFKGLFGGKKVQLAPLYGAPYNVRAVALSPTKVFISWEYINYTKGEYSFAVQRSTSPSGPFSGIAGTIYLNYTDVNVLADTTYCYQIGVRNRTFTLTMPLSDIVCVRTGGTRITCNDDDDGLEYGTAGSVTLYDTGNIVNVSYDTCTTSKLLKEYTCGGASGTDAIPSSYDCSLQGKICEDGACVTGTLPNATCTDSDGGLNYNVKGITKNLSTSNVDYCEGSGVLREYYCYDNWLTSFTSYNCPSGQLCSNGACVQSATTCTDSDGGLNYKVRGDIIGPLASNPNSSRIDFCVDNTTLRELFCNSQGLGEPRLYDCPNGCSNGACVQSATNQTNQTLTCTDSDGNNSLIRGIAQNASSSFTDICSGTSVVREGICIGNIVSSRDNVCSTGYTCSNGACVQSATTCTDSDGGLNYNVRGSTTKPAANASTTGSGFDDICINNIVLQEGYCSDNNITTTIYSCTNGCSNGACIENVNISTCAFFGYNTQDDDSLVSCPAGSIYPYNLSVCRNITRTCTDNDIGPNDYLIASNVNYTYGELLGPSCCFPGEPCASGGGGGGRGVKEDRCEGREIVVEALCNADGTAGEDNVICPSGACSNGACVGQFNAAAVGEPVNGNCASGCLYNDQCVPLGYRVGSKYCSLSREMVLQVPSGDECDNNFECKSNQCSNNLCQEVANGFQRFIANILCSLANPLSSAERQQCIDAFFNNGAEQAAAPFVERISDGGYGSDTGGDNPQQVTAHPPPTTTNPIDPYSNTQPPTDAPPKNHFECEQIDRDNVDTWTEDEDGNIASKEQEEEFGDLDDDGDIDGKTRLKTTCSGEKKYSVRDPEVAAAGGNLVHDLYTLEKTPICNEAGNVDADDTVTWGEESCGQQALCEIEVTTNNDNTKVNTFLGCTEIPCTEGHEPKGSIAKLTHGNIVITFVGGSCFSDAGSDLLKKGVCSGSSFKEPTFAEYISCPRCEITGRFGTSDQRLSCYNGGSLHGYEEDILDFIRENMLK